MPAPTLLAFDTSTEYCTVAFYANKQCFSRTEKLGNGHSDVLLPWIDEFVSDSSSNLKAIDGILFGAGPGSFTGLRIACGVAQGLGFGLDKMVLPTSTLLATGYAFRDQARRIAVLNDARMNECYGAVYQRDEKGFHCVSREQIVKPELAPDWIAQNGADLVVGTAIDVYPMIFTVPSHYAHPDAQAMIQWYLDTQEDSKALWIKSDLAAPLYVRDRVALTIKERALGAKL